MDAEHESWMKEGPGIPATPTLEGWFRGVRGEIGRTLDRVIRECDEAPADDRWAEAQARMLEYALRPGKRIRPAILLAGYGLGDGDEASSERLYPFAAGIEILHTFMLIHDDIADGAGTRRGGPALHQVCGGGKKGEDLAVVLGDYLFARAIEVMLACRIDGVGRAVQHYLGVCRQAAVGQYLDLDLSGISLSDVSLFQTIRVARLKTAGPGFAAPLAAGAMLAGACSETIERLNQIGDSVGVAFQLRDDVLGMYGEADVAGKPCDSDLTEGKRTFPVIAAYLQASEEDRREMGALWSSGEASRGSLARARELVKDNGGLAATEHEIARASRTARDGLRHFSPDNHFRRLLDGLISQLAQRDA